MSAEGATSTLYPDNTAAVQECVQTAVRDGSPVEVVGGGSKRFYGRPVSASRTLSLAKLSGVIDYQPAELLVVVRPGTPLAELERTLAESKQALAFEPPHWGAEATVGGTVACNLSGPRRVRAGAVRDHLLGFEVVTGRGQIVRGGGRVVKNVTGYDLSKLMSGSFGTLGVLTELVLKVLPAAETERTVVVTGLDDPEAIALLILASRSPHNVSGLAHLPRVVRAPTGLSGVAADGEPVTLIRLEGPAPSVEHRAREIVGLTARPTTSLEAEASASVWSALRELAPIAVGAGERLWRVSVPPTASAACSATLSTAAASSAAGATTTPRAFFDWGGGLIWCALPASLAATEVHRVAQEAGGHARLVRAADAAQESGRDEAVDQAFAPLDAASRTIHQRLKLAFDPSGVLNPGRMYADL
ncbi:MAG: glycolate oxidase subunit GlcE [Acidobacteria bacterium]|nr:glycolate oxidase subunit GlcE [Acidobacteriota bacterium]